MVDTTDWNELTREKQKQRMFNNRLDRLNRLVELRAPRTILFNEAILVAKACLPTDDISTETLIERLQQG